MAALGAVGVVDRVVEGGVGVRETDVFSDATGLDPTFTAALRGAMPGGAVPVTRADAEVWAIADDPNRHRLPQRPVGAERRDFQFFRCADRVEFVAGPDRHRDCSVHSGCGSARYSSSVTLSRHFALCSRSITLRTAGRSSIRSLKPV